MGQRNLSALAIVQEALGFAVHRFGTALRVAWLPLVLILFVQVLLSRLGFLPEGAAFALKMRVEPGWVTKLTSVLPVVFEVDWANSDMVRQASSLLGLVGIAAVLQTSYMVPLVRFASGSGVPSHRSMVLGFGVRHLKSLLASAAAFGAVLLAAGYLLRWLSGWATSAVQSVLNRQDVVFAEGSLHSSELTPAMPWVQDLLTSVDTFFYSMGIPIGAVGLAVLIPVMLVAGYVIMRLLAWPYLVNAFTAGDRPAFRQSLALSRGLNIFPLMAVVLLFVVLSMITALVTGIGAATVFTLTATGSEIVLQSYEAFIPDAATGPIVRGLIMVLFGAASIAIAAFLAAFQAGLGGALVHRARAL